MTDRSVADPCRAAGRCLFTILHSHGAVCGAPCPCSRCIVPRTACQDVTGACGHAEHVRGAAVGRAVEG